MILDALRVQLDELAKLAGDAEDGDRELLIAVDLGRRLIDWLEPRART